jgi:mono/diheme cytochrome c family protein
MSKTVEKLALAVLVGLLGTNAAQAAEGSAKGSVERGRYLVQVAGCNDCHTPGYAMTGGKVPESQWLTGDALGWRGGWGTTYAANLRLRFAAMSEDEWLQVARHAEYRPPMPWTSLRAMSDADLRSLWRYVRSLGPAGEPAPAYVPPGQAPTGPVVLFPGP